MRHAAIAMQVDRLVWDRTRPAISFSLGQTERLYLCGEGAEKLLLVLAGFLPSLGGGVLCEGRSLVGVAPPSRHVAYIPPGDSLVRRQNLRANVMLAGASRARAAEALQVLGLAHLATTKLDALETGQRRLGALARALAADPALLLVAEGADPAASPDAIPAALAELPAPPAIVATASVAVALARAVRILLLREGVAVQLAAPREMFERPADRFAACWAGPCNLLPATLDGHGPFPGSVVALVAGQRMLARFRDSTTGPVALAVRPHALAVAADGIPASLTGVDFQGATTRLRLALPDGCTLALDTTAPVPAQGEALRVTWAWTDAWPVAP